jgi:hypothetical protein
MAQIVQIPMSFDFTIRKLRWIEVEGVIAGSSTDSFGDLQLKAQLSVNGKMVFINVEGEATPDPTWERWDKFCESDDTDAAARQLFSDFRPRFFVAVDQDASGTTLTSQGDAWQLRDAFLKLDPAESSVLAFLNQWGRWTYQDYTQLYKILEFREKIRRALLSPSNEWLSGYESNLDLETRSRYPNLLIQTEMCEKAIRATITLDLLRKIRFKTCARPDCQQHFQITSQHKRKYCCQYCAHLESLRRNRVSSRKRR